MNQRVRLILNSTLTLAALAACGGPGQLPLRPQMGHNAGQQFKSPTRFNSKWVLKKRTPHMPGEVIVQMKGQFSTQNLRAFSTGQSRPKQRLRIDDQEFMLVEAAQPEKMEQLLDSLKQDPHVEYVAPNPRYMALGVSSSSALRAPAPRFGYATAPRLRRFDAKPSTNKPENGLNDALLPLQWALPKVGIPHAWNMGGQGVKEITVAVIDSGVDYQHPDLKGQIVNGKDFMSEHISGPDGEGSPDVVDDDPLDQMGHGTHVAGIIAALPNNETGVAGIAPGAKLLNIKSLNAEGWGSAFAIAQGITYAVDQGAQIINLSLGSPQGSKPIELAIQYAIKKGALIIAAAGNSYTHTGYPASYPGVVAVGASDQEDWLADFSNHDARINVVAPGVDIMSTTPTFLTNTMAQNGIDAFYSSMSGTSMAAPMVSAQAALVWSRNPSLTAEEVKAIIQRSSKKVGDQRIFGHGRIQIDAALEMVSGPPAGAPPQQPQPPIEAQAFRRRF